VKKYCLLIILNLFASIFAFAQFSDESNTNEDYTTGVRPVTIPVFNPESDRFFGNELQNAFIRGKSRRFTFISLYGDLFKIPDNVIAHDDSSNNNDKIVRLSAAIGGMLPISDYLSVMGGGGIVRDYIYLAESWNHFYSAGVFGHYTPWGIGLGILGGYYQNNYRELTLSDDGFYHGTIFDQPRKITKAARFMIVPRMFLDDKIFFLDELSANIGFSEKADELKILSRLAFRAVKIGAERLGINIYYNQYKYNMLLDQRLFGAMFDSKYCSFDFGYRQFINPANNPLAPNYKDGMFGRIIAKIWANSNYGTSNKFPILLSYSFEQTFKMHHFFGIGLQFGMNKMTTDYLFETNIAGDGRIGWVIPGFE